MLNGRSARPVPRVKQVPQSGSPHARRKRQRTARQTARYGTAVTGAETIDIVLYSTISIVSVVRTAGLERGPHGGAGAWSEKPAWTRAPQTQIAHALRPQ